MIGTPVECTVWKVTWRHRRVDSDDPAATVSAEAFVLTADPSGDDLAAVVRSVAKTTTAQGKDPECFVIEHAVRVQGGTRGTASVPATEASPWFANASARVLDAWANEITDLRRELAAVKRTAEVQAAELRRLHAERGELPELEAQPAVPATDGE